MTDTINVIEAGNLAALTADAKLVDSAKKPGGDNISTTETTRQKQLATEQAVWNSRLTWTNAADSSVWSTVIAVSGTQATVSSYAKTAGQLLASTDDARLFLDISTSSRLELSSVYNVDTQSALPAIPLANKVYSVRDTHKLMFATITSGIVSWHEYGDQTYQTKITSSNKLSWDLVDHPAVGGSIIYNDGGTSKSVSELAATTASGVSYSITASGVLTISANPQILLKAPSASWTAAQAGKFLKYTGTGTTQEWDFPTAAQVGAVASPTGTSGYLYMTSSSATPAQRTPTAAEIGAFTPPAAGGSAYSNLKTAMVVVGANPSNTWGWAEVPEIPSKSSLTAGNIYSLAWQHTGSGTTGGSWVWTTGGGSGSGYTFVTPLVQNSTTNVVTLNLASYTGAADGMYLKLVNTGTASAPVLTPQWAAVGGGGTTYTFTSPLMLNGTTNNVTLDLTNYTGAADGMYLKLVNTGTTETPVLTPQWASGGGSSSITCTAPLVKLNDNIYVDWGNSFQGTATAGYQLCAKQVGTSWAAEWVNPTTTVTTALRGQTGATAGYVLKLMESTGGTLYPVWSSAGASGVTSVNGKTGTVVQTYSDVDADEEGTAQDLMDEHTTTYQHNMFISSSDTHIQQHTITISGTALNVDTVATTIAEEQAASAMSTHETTYDHSSFVISSSLATVATSGSYYDLTDAPTFAQVATTGDYNDQSNTPSLAAVATSGSYTDLSDTPTIPDPVLYESEAVTGLVAGDNITMSMSSGQLTIASSASGSGVESVNGKTGVVTLDYSDVSAIHDPGSGTDGYVLTYRTNGPEWAAGTSVSASETGTATTEAKYLTINGTEWKLASGGGTTYTFQSPLSVDQSNMVSIDQSSYATTSYADNLISQHDDLSTAHSTLFLAKQDVIDTTHKQSSSQVDGLSAVATSGDYDDLGNRPSCQGMAISSLTAGTGITLSNASGTVTIENQVSYTFQSPLTLGPSNDVSVSTSEMASAQSTYFDAAGTAVSEASSAISSHNIDSTAHSGMFDTAGTADSAVTVHDSSTAAHTNGFAHSVAISTTYNGITVTDTAIDMSVTGASGFCSILLNKDKNSVSMAGVYSRKESDSVNKLMFRVYAPSSGSSYKDFNFYSTGYVYLPITPDSSLNDTSVATTAYTTTAVSNHNTNKSAHSSGFNHFIDVFHNWAGYRCTNPDIDLTSTFSSIVQTIPLISYDKNAKQLCYITSRWHAADSIRMSLVVANVAQTTYKELALYNNGDDGAIIRSDFVFTDCNANTPAITNNSTRIATTEFVRKIVPAGTVIAYAGSTVPSGYLPCYGAAYSRTTYADLFAAIGTTYGTGDGSTTFNVPNLTDKFIQGNSTVGTVKSAGLPNISGSFGCHVPSSHSRYSSGAFTAATIGTSTDGAPVQQSTAGTVFGYAFNANTGAGTSGIYGNSSTVQPPALTMNFAIKY